MQVVGTFTLFPSMLLMYIFFVQGVSLRTADVFRAFNAWPGLVFGLFSILLATPCFGLGLMAMNIQPREFSIGFAVAVAVPTTLSSGI